MDDCAVIPPMAHGLPALVYHSVNSRRAEEAAEAEAMVAKVEAEETGE